jgi:hypothetical protein
MTWSQPAREHTHRALTLDRALLPDVVAHPNMLPAVSSSRLNAR